MTLSLAQAVWKSIIEEEEEMNEALLTKLQQLWASKPGPVPQKKLLVAACRWLLHADEPEIPPATACRGLACGLDTRVRQKMEVIQSSSLADEVRRDFKSVAHFPNRGHPWMGPRKQWAAVRAEADGEGEAPGLEAQEEVEQPRVEAPTIDEAALLIGGAEQMRQQVAAYQERLPMLSQQAAEAALATPGAAEDARRAEERQWVQTSSDSSGGDTDDEDDCSICGLRLGRRRLVQQWDCECFQHKRCVEKLRLMARSNPDLIERCPLHQTMPSKRFSSFTPNTGRTRASPSSAASSSTAVSASPASLERATAIPGSASPAAQDVERLEGEHFRLEVKESRMPEAGGGCFAGERIPKGSVIGEYVGQRQSWPTDWRVDRSHTRAAGCGVLNASDPKGVLVIGGRSQHVHGWSSEIWHARAPRDGPGGRWVPSEASDGGAASNALRFVNATAMSPPNKRMKHNAKFLKGGQKMVATDDIEVGDEVRVHSYLNGTSASMPQRAAAVGQKVRLGGKAEVWKVKAYSVIDDSYELMGLSTMRVRREELFTNKAPLWAWVP